MTVLLVTEGKLWLVLHVNLKLTAKQLGTLLHSLSGSLLHKSCDCEEPLCGSNIDQGDLGII